MKKPETVKFTHTADWHILDRQYGRSFRGDDFRKAIRECVEISIRNGVDFILNGGDTLHNNRPSELMLEFLFEIHTMLQAAGIPMYTVTGNHDVSNPSFLIFPSIANSGEPKEKTLDFSYQGPTGIVCIDNRIITHKGIRIAGFPALVFKPAGYGELNEDGSPKEVQLDVENGNTLLEKIHGAEPVDIAIWHGALQEFVPFPMPGSGNMEMLPSTYAKAWLLGDIHLRGRKRLDNGVLVSYPGPVEMCERGEPREKFVDFYELAPDWRDRPFPEPVELPIDTRPVLFLTVGNDAEADQALSKIRESIHDNPGRSPLIFATYAREQRPWVNRVNETIDPRDTVFRAAMFRSNFQSAVTPGVHGALPTLQSVVSEVLPAGSAPHEVALKLVMPGAPIRDLIVAWKEEMLSKATA